MKLELDDNEVAYLLGVLQKQPLEQSLVVYSKIQKQVQEQQPKDA